MEITRNAYQRLLDWKKSSSRKPLIVRGARQVGKTTLIRAFGRTYAHFIELNLEREADRKLFEVDEVDKLLNTIFLLKNVPRSEEPTLLFIDEIQESPKAIKQLRYLYEEAPSLHVIAAGSLLEFALSKVPNFPVGRVEYLYLHPINFAEYLKAIDNHQALKLLTTVPIPDYAHTILLKLFQDYAIIGGMPGIVQAYLSSRDLVALSTTYQNLWQAYRDDVEKYARNESEKRIIRHVMQSAPAEKDRIKFEGFGNSNYRSREVGEAMRDLDLAKIIQLIYPTTSLRPPLVTDFKKRPRLQFLDTGLLNQALGLQAELLQLSHLDDFFKGRIIQHLVYQEVISIHEQVSFKPCFWVREEKDSNSEVDLVIAHARFLIPVEIKSGKSGSLRSLHQFIDRCDHPYAVRFSAASYSVEQTQTPNGKPYYLMNIPYYLGTCIKDYLQFFVEKFQT